MKKKGKRKSKSGIAGKGRRQNTTWHRANIISAISVFLYFLDFRRQTAEKEAEKQRKIKKEKKIYFFFLKNLKLFFSVSKK